MLWNRGNAADFDAWVSLGNDGWGWSDLLPYFQKSENYTPICYPPEVPPPVHFLTSAHGFSGPVNVSYPGYYWRQSNDFFDALNELGVPMAFDPNDGQAAGGFFIPSSVDPINQTRSHARRAYYDPVASRSNLLVQDNSQVTRIFFQTNGYGMDNTSTPQFVATGVEFASDPAAPRQTVWVTREVILAAGALHTPQLLQLSGIGNASLLSSFNITVLNDLPGVGNNLQDHCLIHLDYVYGNTSYTTPDTALTNSTYNLSAEQEYLSSHTGPWTGRPSSAVAFPSLAHMANQSWIASLLSTANASPASTPSTYDGTLSAGFALQRSLILDALALNTTPAFENLNNNGGNLDVSLMHPLSRGTVQIVSGDPFVPPAVDPRWLSHPADAAIMAMAVSFNQRLLDTAALSPLAPQYTAGVPRDPSPADLAALLAAGAATEYHYSGTAAMLPLSLGGVVSPSLLVFGTHNLRVVDTSLFPLLPGAHLQAVAYAVAERAADLIRQIDSVVVVVTNASVSADHLGGLETWVACEVGEVAPRAGIN